MRRGGKPSLFYPDNVCSSCLGYERQQGAPPLPHLWKGAITPCANCGEVIRRDPKQRNKWTDMPSKFIPDAPQICRTCNQYE